MEKRNELEQEVLELLNYSDQEIRKRLFITDQDGEQEQWITKRLGEAITESEIREVMIVELLMWAITQSEEPEPFE